MSRSNEYKGAGMEPLGAVELDPASLPHVFSFLCASGLVDSLNKQCREYVTLMLGDKIKNVSASTHVSPWPLPSLGLTSLTYRQKKQFILAAAEGGCFSTLQWAREQGCPWDSHASKAAAGAGHLAVLQWLRQERCHWDDQTLTIAAGRGHLEVFEWGLRHGCPGSSAWVCWVVAAIGKLEMLQCIRRNGCPWDASVCAAAAGSGNLLMLQWAREHGCPWDQGTCQVAARDGHVEVLQWSWDEGCPWGADTCSAAA
jgi:hypothetical protein